MQHDLMKQIEAQKLQDDEIMQQLQSLQVCHSAGCYLTCCFPAGHTFCSQLTNDNGDLTCSHLALLAAWTPIRPHG